LQSTAAFDAAEIAVAMELIDCGLSTDTKGYRFAVAAGGEEPIGYACFGDAPLTDAVFDLYWIAVQPAAQRSGVGRALLTYVEAEIAALGGRWLLIETASKPSYAATRAFYLRAGYQEIARIPDFYRLGDDKITYGKRFDRGPR
jgi:ribosomal protein S18 acetylase RimI-like enzyme